ncbi:MAG: DUF853 family protein, partial [Nitrosomonadales bacterium]|nr:DUF853 family protein [Nitrosomonadales bacterium]
LLFNDAPKALMDKIEQVVRLIRSKGVGIYFVSQNPLDIPDVVLGQLGNRVQHALRAFTPRDQKAVKSAAETFRSNPKVDVVSAITDLGVGEALVSFLDEKGRPMLVERAFIIPPGSRIGMATDDERSQSIRSSLIYGYYEKSVDRESAYEILKARATESVAQAEAQATAKIETAPKRPVGRQPDTLIETMAKTAARTVGSELGRRLIRGVLGSLMGGKK